MLKLPTKNKKIHFTPTALIIVFLLSYFLVGLTFKADFLYFYTLTIAGSFLCLKSYILAFGIAEKSINDKKENILLSGLVLGLAQVVLAMIGIRQLTDTTYPFDTVQWYLIASLIFSISTFLARLDSSIKYGILATIIYTISLGLLFFKVFDDNSNAFLIMLNAIGYISLGVESLMLANSAKVFINNK